MDPLTGPLPHDTQALIADLVQQHQAYVRALAVRLAPSAAEGDDVAQDAFLLLMRKRAEFDLTREVRPLLAAIVRNLAKQAWDRAIRDNRQRRDDLADYLDTVAEDARQSHADWNRAALEDCLTKLTTRERDLLNLRYTLDCPSEEIARRLASSADAVRMALVRLRSRLKECIERTLGGSRA